MKILILGFLFLGLAGTALAADRSDLDSRVRELTAKFEELQSKPDRAVPPDVLRKAKGIILLDRVKAGFLFAYQGGGGVALARNEHSDNWSPVAFLAANEASLGFQVGGEQTFYVILLMSTNATRLLTDPNFQLGSEARGTAGNSSGGPENSISSNEHPFLIYDDRKGLYGGADIKGGAVTPDEQDNRTYYGQYYTMADILFDHKVEPTESAINLANRINYFSEPRDEDTKTVRN